LCPSTRVRFRAQRVELDEDLVRDVLADADREQPRLACVEVAEATVDQFDRVALLGAAGPWFHRRLLRRWGLRGWVPWYGVNTKIVDTLPPGFTFATEGVVELVRNTIGGGVEVVGNAPSAAASRLLPDRHRAREQHRVESRP